MRIKLWMLLCILSISSAFAQDMKSVFISMPDSIAPLLTKVNKEDCVDFLVYDMKAEVKNRFGGVTELKVLTDDYLFLQTTANSSMEMKLLPVNDSTKVVCMIKTVCSSACDSEVHFYSSDWKQKLMTTDYLSTGWPMMSNRVSVVILPKKSYSATPFSMSRPIPQYS